MSQWVYRANGCERQRSHREHNPGDAVLIIAGPRETKPTRPIERWARRVNGRLAGKGSPESQRAVAIRRPGCSEQGTERRPDDRACNPRGPSASRQTENAGMIRGWSRHP